MAPGHRSLSGYANYKVSFQAPTLLGSLLDPFTLTSCPFLESYQIFPGFPSIPPPSESPQEASQQSSDSPLKIVLFNPHRRAKELQFSSAHEGLYLFKPDKVPD